ncbi:MAG: UDP-N-acetylglucosamine 2-epimerase (non-hydrolyzing) [bacterium]
MSKKGNCNGIKKIILTFGTRPEAIKMAPVYFTLKKDKKFDVKLVLTGQHTKMLDDALNVFGMKPEYNLNIMVARQTLAGITARAVKKLDAVYKKEKPDLVLVHGDTSTTFASALAAFYNGIPAGHVEAGLRTHVKNEPFPEEINRVLTDRTADLLFPPTEQAKKNLLKEGGASPMITVTGNTVVDAVELLVKKAGKVPPLISALPKASKSGFVLFTMHRRESWGKPLERIFLTLRNFFEKNTGVKLIYPVHPNPAVSVPAHKILSGAGIILTPPLRYSDLIFLLRKCLFIVTDSGGVQEEAAVFKKRVLLLRRYTERPEGVRAGFVKVMGLSPAKLKREMEMTLKNGKIFDRMKKIKNPYGDGKASERIHIAVRKFFKMPVKKSIKEFRG